MTASPQVSSQQVDQVRASLTRCLNQSGFISHFYQVFLGSAPEIAPMFQHTDMKRQHFMLAASLKTMVLYARTPLGAEPESLKALAVRHDRNNRNIPAHLYQNWLEALVQSVTKFDPEFKPELLTAWRTVMQKGISYMSSNY